MWVWQTVGSPVCHGVRKKPAPRDTRLCWCSSDLPPQTPAFLTQGRQNISPDKIPWSALKTLMAQSIYGGRVDNEFDQRLLNTFLERLFTTKSFDSEFKLACKVDGHKDIQMPDGIRYEPASRDLDLCHTSHLTAPGKRAFPNVLVFQARGVCPVGGAAPRHPDALLAGPSQQRRESPAHHPGWVPRAPGPPLALLLLPPP